MPMKEPMDRNRPNTSKWDASSSAVLYSLTDLQRRERSSALVENNMVLLPTLLLYYLPNMVCVHVYYHIALNFQGSFFLILQVSQIFNRSQQSF